MLDVHLRTLTHEVVSGGSRGSNSPRSASGWDSVSISLDMFLGSGR